MKPAAPDFKIAGIGLNRGGAQDLPNPNLPVPCAAGGHLQRKRAEILWDNFDTIIVYRPAVGDLHTAEFMQKKFGDVSAYAQSLTKHNHEATAEGESEKAIPLVTSWDFQRINDETTAVFHRDLPGFFTNRIDVRNYPHLMERMAIPSPALPELPEVAEIPPLARQSQETFPEFIDLDQAQ